ncbi:Uu.00g144280.m01.CDS01 [Anthostomella pinea]|uniref:Uu.00g144280.m01.CDS01 n=1 Tax=Anthostomella pinea TaxID=933095 RepID=A0AAI8VS02_9PEZI|nr:Uu.00g144280.m01.CDS01 [Anthostomella pinea]
MDPSTRRRRGRSRSEQSTSSDGSDSCSDSDDYDTTDIAVYKAYEEKEMTDDASGTQAARRSLEPSVVWAASVFDVGAQKRRDKKKPVAIYYSDSPHEISIFTPDKNGLQDSSTDSGRQRYDDGSVRPSWSGRVFEVSCNALAHLPHEQKPGWPRLEDAQVEMLKFEKISSSSIVVKSPFLYSGLRALARYYPSFWGQPAGDLLNQQATRAADVSGEITIHEPWGFLLHHFMEMEAFIQSTSEDSPWISANASAAEKDAFQLEREHIQHLYDFVKPRYEAQVLPCTKLLEATPPKMIPFDMLWYVFAPGTDVYLQQTGLLPQVCVVTRVSSDLDDEGSHGSRFSQRRREYWNLELWYLDSDGQSITRRSRTCRIRTYPGVEELICLDVCPVDVWDKHDNFG